MPTPSPWAQYATRTSGKLAFGVLLLVAGSAVGQYSMQEQFVAAISGDEAFPFLGWAGGAAAVIGLITLVIGIHDLAANVEIIAERAGYEIAVSRSEADPHPDRARSARTFSTVSPSAPSIEPRDVSS